jgi:hypothetical protein
LPKLTIVPWPFEGILIHVPKLQSPSIKNGKCGPKDRAPVPSYSMAVPGIVPAGGLKLIVGKYCVNTGGAAGVASNEPEESKVKNLPNTVPVETGCEGTSQVTVVVLELALALA